MSAIAGILKFNSAPLEPGLIERMTGAMASRGPDGASHWTGKGVAFGHCMLRSTTESDSDHQPLISEDGSLVLIMDGRLDNRGDLLRELEGRGVVTLGGTDPALLLGAYRLWGEKCVQFLLGDFVFAVWDSREHKLFCARDHLGARPLYYTRNTEFLAFASEDEALLRLPGVSSNPNEELIAHMLVPEFQTLDSRRSWLQDIWMLSPASILSACPDGKVRVETYWSLIPGEGPTYESDLECQEAFLDVFGEAVRCRMRGAGHIGAMMSGGLDSAGIAAMVGRLLPEFKDKKFHTYSTVHDEPESCIESQCIKALTRNLGTGANFVSVPSLDGTIDLNDLIQTAWTNAHPIDNSILLPAMMCLSASRNGDRVLLHGVSGDITTHVPDRYPLYLLRQGKWPQAWRECVGASRNHTFLRKSSPISLFGRNIWSAYVPEIIRYMFRHIKQGSPDLSNSAINSAFAGNLQVDEKIRARQSWHMQQDFAEVGLDHAQVMNKPGFGIERGLTGYEHMAGRFGIELRDPWADKRVLEFFLNLPITHKVRDGWTKILTRTSFSKELAPVVTTRRSKEHLGWLYISRLMLESEVFINDTFQQHLEVIYPYINKNAVRARYEKYRRSNCDRDREFVYDIMTLVLWLRRISR